MLTMQRENKIAKNRRQKYQSSRSSSLPGDLQAKAKLISNVNYILKEEAEPENEEEEEEEVNERSNLIPTTTHQTLESYISASVCDDAKTQKLLPKADETETALNLHRKRLQQKAEATLAKDLAKERGLFNTKRQTSLPAKRTQPHATVIRTSSHPVPLGLSSASSNSFASQKRLGRHPPLRREYAIPFPSHSKPQLQVQKLHEEEKDISPISSSSGSFGGAGGGRTVAAKVIEVPPLASPPASSKNNTAKFNVGSSCSSINGCHAAGSNGIGNTLGDSGKGGGGCSGSGGRGGSGNIRRVANLTPPPSPHHAATNNTVTRALSFPLSASPPSPSYIIAGSQSGRTGSLSRKRTRFHQRSMTMAATSPSRHPGGGGAGGVLVSHLPSSSSGHIPCHYEDLNTSEMKGSRSLDISATHHVGATSRQQQHNKNKASQHGNQRHNASSSKSSTPSMLFTKVKERIREKVFQSSEWPNAAAMIQEKRQRANDMLEASLNSRKDLNLEQIQLHEKQRKKTTLRSKSDSGRYSPCPSTSQTGLYGEPSVTMTNNQQDDEGPSEKDLVRQAFRRRSISEDTYDRGVNIIMKKNGIVCSNEDLGDIMQEQQTLPQSNIYKNKRSPRPLKKHQRTQSLDISRITAKENQQSGQTGSIYLDPQVSMASSSSTVSSIKTIDSVESDIHVQRASEYLEALQPNVAFIGRGEGSSSTNLYPDIVLDDKSKETIMEEKSNCENEAVDGEEEEKEKNEQIEQKSGNNGSKGKEGRGSASGISKKKNKPVPEIVFDENGQTWDVYGADFDPEVLGLAIQHHLETMMERMMAGVNPRQDGLATGVAKSASKDDKDKVDTKSDSGSFWLRYLCLFAGKKEVKTS